jgi:hypothetical protein
MIIVTGDILPAATPVLRLSFASGTIVAGGAREAGVSAVNMVAKANHRPTTMLKSIDVPMVLILIAAS